MRIISTSDAEPLVGLMIPTTPRHVSDAIFFPPLAQALEMLFANKNSSMGLLQKLTRASRVSKSGKRG